MDWIAILAIILSLIIIGFLSGIEIAFVSVNKLSIELKRKKGSYSGITWGKYSDNPAKFIATILIGLNIVLVIYGLLIGDLLAPIWNWTKNLLPPSASDYVDYIRLLIETFLSTSIILFIEFMSKAIFKAKNNMILDSNMVSYVTQFFYNSLSTLSNMFVKMAEWILQYILNVKINRKKESFSKIDLEHLFHENKSHDEESKSEMNKTLFENALSLSETKIKKCLIPRKEIEGLNATDSIETTKEKFIETKLSKLVVFDGNIDNIIGYVHHLDLFKSPATLNEILHPIPTIPETMNATDLMTKFSKERKSIAWVIDEFGGTAGIVTMEDLLEELFGEIEDEYDVPETLIDKQISKDEYLFSGRVSLHFIEQKYHLVFEGKEGAETLSGYIIQNHQRIPKQKERIIIDNIEFDILNVTETRIETVKAKVLN